MTNSTNFGNCPICGAPVANLPRSYGCSKFKEGCQFAIWKTIAGKEITEEMAIQLMQEGRIEKLDGFKSKDGKEFSAALQMRENKVELVFDQEVIGDCPVCGKPITESAKAFGCSGYKEGCQFVIWKSIAGKEITKEEALELISMGRTDKMDGFKSKAGNEFTAGLEIIEGKVELYF